MINNAYSDLIRKEPMPSQTFNERYSGHDKNNYKSSINIGCNFIFGNNRFVKHIIGINYLRSKGEYNYKSSSINEDSHGYVFYNEDTHYNSTIHFINVVSGFHFTIVKKIKLELCGSLNLIGYGFNRINGTINRSYNYDTGYYKETEVYVNHKEPVNDIVLYTISFCPKISYEFKFKKQKMDAYFSYNLAARYNLPWYMFGVAYYPFKKLR